jgi:hypothetical protein
MVSAHWNVHLMMNEPDAVLYEKYYANGAIYVRDPELAAVLAYFDELDRDVDVPKLKAIAPRCLFHLIDTTSFNPAGYRVAYYDRRATLDGGRDYTNLNFGDYPVKVYRENLEQQVCTAWAMHTRRFSEVKWSRHGGDTRCFNRLIIPLDRSPATGNSAQILLATHPQPADIAA